MSNREISALYESVIRKVIDESRDDFYDSGMDEATLQDLRALWIEKLQATRVAEFSWAKLQDEENGIHGDPDAASNVSAANNSTSIAGNDDTGTNINQEDEDYDAHNTTSKKESKNNSVFQDPESGLVLPTNSQTDGANFDLSSVSKGEPVTFQMNVQASHARQIFENVKDSHQTQDSEVKIDKQQRATVKPSAFQEDGTAAPDKEDDDDDDDVVDEDDDDDNEDEEKVANESDEINSDLDDTEDEDNLSLNGGEDGKLNDNYIFCLYDKVQRVKNKWKFSLKDGVASINGKDYGFNKATGESDW